MWIPFLISTFSKIYGIRNLKLDLHNNLDLNLILNLNLNLNLILTPFAAIIVDRGLHIKNVMTHL
jgi:hypothetical protein